MTSAFRSMAWHTRIAVAVIIVYMIVVMLAPVLAPYGETAVVGRSFEPWSEKFLLGTDNLGRDMASRLMYGARNTVVLALVINTLGFILGVVLGFAAAASSKWIDQILSRIVDTLMSVPQLIFALLVLAILGSSLPVLVTTIVILDATRFFRLARAVAMDIVVMDYVEAARVRGEGLWWCIRREILPNALPTLMAEYGIRFCYVCLFIAGLSFLGLGLQPPSADLGSMVKDNAGLITFGYLTPLLPAAALALLTVSVNFVVDWFSHWTTNTRA
ncbi:MAG: ABC transporter permease [Pseudorhodoplanes sp.]